MKTSKQRTQHSAMKYRSKFKTMNARRRLLMLTHIMVAACAVILMFVIGILYSHEIKMHRDLLQVTARSRARFIEAVARFDENMAIKLGDSYPEPNAFSATLDQIMEAHENFEGFGKTGEFTLAQKNESAIHFLLSHRKERVATPQPVAFESDLAKPMRLALEGLSGTIIGPDYRGEMVVAAFEPVAVLNLGIVVKIDIAEVRAPFIKAGLAATSVALIVILVGMGLFVWIGNPVIEQLETQAAELQSEILHRIESERKLKAFMESATEGFIFYDSELKLISINATALALLPIEHSEQKLIGKSIKEIECGIEKTKRFNRYIDVLQSGEPESFDDKIPSHGLGPRDVSVHVFKVNLGLGVIFTDITERKIAEQNLATSEERFRTICENAPVLINGFDTNGRCMLWNKQCKKTFGWTIDEINAHENTLNLFYPDPNICNEVIKTLTTDPDGIFKEWHPKTKAGQTLTTMWANFGLPNGQVFSLGHDITEARQTEAELQLALKHYKLLAENTLDIIWVMDLNLNFTYINPAIKAATGYSMEEWLQTNLADHCDPQNFNLIKRMMTHDGEDGPKSTGVVFEAKILKKDGHPFTAEIHSKLIFDNHGSPTSFQGTTRDITERKLAELKLQEAHHLLEERVIQRTNELKIRTDEAETLNRSMINLLEDLGETNQGLEAAEQALRTTNHELEAFAYSVSHDLRAPLRHIDGFIQLLIKREKNSLDSTSKHYLENIVEASHRMAQLIDDLLALSRTSRTTMNYCKVDSNEIVRQTINGLSSATKGRHIEWGIENLPMVKADRGLLKIVWENLIGNAIKYTGRREEAHITIGTTNEKGEEGADEIAFFIRDDGAGFNPQYTNKLFGVFQRLHSDQEFEGTGIGLATVQRIIHRHGGRVWASGQVDHGATFYFTLKNTKGTE